MSWKNSLEVMVISFAKSSVHVRVILWNFKDTIQQVLVIQWGRMDDSEHKRCKSS